MNNKIIYRWNNSPETDYIITDGIYDFADWLSDNGVNAEKDGDTFYVIGSNGERTGETYTIIREEPTDEDLIG